MKRFFDWLLGNKVLLVTGVRLHAYAEYHKKFVFHPTCSVKHVMETLKPYDIYKVELCRSAEIKCPKQGFYKVLTEEYLVTTYD